MASVETVDRLVTLPELSARYGVPFSRVHLYRLEAAGKFPRRLHLSDRRIAWSEAEILAWKAQRQAERPGVVAFDDLKRAKAVA